MLQQSALCANPVKFQSVERRLIVLSLTKELMRYMSARKKWWLSPIIAVLVLIGGALVLAQGSAIAPFIYTVF